MLALRQSLSSPVMLSIHRESPPRSRASIGSRRNPASTSAILDAAATLLREHGPAAFTIDAVARLARCGKPTVYRWWPDKLALLAELHERELAALPASGDSLNGWTHDVLAFWRRSVTGPALRAIVAESTTALDGARRLRDVLLPYEEAARELVAASGVAEFAARRQARAAVAQLAFALLVGTNVDMSANLAEVALPISGDRAEWVV